MRGKFLAGSAGLMATVLLAAGCGSGGTSSDSATGVSSSTITIGVDVPLTGVASDVGLGFQLGTNLAVSEINAHGGINGRKIKVRYEDDAGTAQGGVEASRKLVQQDKVFAVYSGATSTAAVSAAPLFSQYKVPLYESLASDTRIIDPVEKYVFMGQAVPREQVAENVADFAHSNLKAKSLDLIIASDQAFCVSGVDQIKAAAKKVGVTVAGEQQFTSGDTDFTGQIEGLKNSKANAVYVCGLGVDGGRMAPQLRRAVPSVDIMVDATMSNPDLISAAGSAANGIYGFWPASTQYVTATADPMGDWRARIQKFSPHHTSNLPNAYTLMGYADFYVFAEGLLKAGKSPTRDKFVDALNNVTDFVAGKDGNFTYASPVGLPRTFTAKDHNGNKTEVPIVVKNGQWQTIGTS